MPILPYAYYGPIDHTIRPDLSDLRGKSVVITGGANGIGETCVRVFCNAGAFVTFADINARGREIEIELNANGTRCAWVRCDIRGWLQQKELFRVAKTMSPSKSIDIVIANAGISRKSEDGLWTLDDPNGEPTCPDLQITGTNLRGTLYTWKLAVHYFRQQPDTAARDRCFIITGSMDAYIDSPGNWEYTATKCALLGFMKTARRSSWEQGIRINYVAPGWIKSNIRSKEYEDWLIQRGAKFGERVDVAACMVRIACDKLINGRSLMITPRSVSKSGYMDIDREDYKDIPSDQYLKQLQESHLAITDDKWEDGYKVMVQKD